MKQAGQVGLCRFPQIDLKPGKLRPVLLLGQLPSRHSDWLTCMILTQLQQYIPKFDEIIDKDDVDFVDSGLKTMSLIRTGRLAVIGGDAIVGAIGAIAKERVLRIKQHLAEWLLDRNAGQPTD